MLETLENRDYLKLWLAQLVSRLGDGIHEIALAWLVLDLTGSALSMGVTLAVSAIPNVIFGLPAGVVVDRFSRKWIMVLSNVVRTFFVLLIPLASLWGVLQLWMVYAVAFLTSSAEAFFGPARMSAIPNIVKEQNLDPANSLVRMTTAVSSLFGLSAGGAVVAFFGPANSFYLDSLSFFLSFALVSFIVLEARPREGMENLVEEMLDKIKEGLSYVTGDPFIKRMLLLALALNFILAPINVIVPFLVKQVMELGSTIYGGMMAALSGGMLIGSLIIGNFQLHRGKAIATGILGIGTGVTLFPAFFLLGEGILLPTILLVCLLGACLLGIGASSSFSNIPISTLLQKKTEDSRRGRVMSIFHVGATAAVPVAYGLVGSLLEQVGAVPVLFGIGGLTLLGAGAVFSSPQITGTE